MIIVVDTKYHGWTLKELLPEYQISRKRIKRIKLCGDLLVNGKHESVRYIVSSGDTIEVVFGLEETTMAVEVMDLDIYYEDEHYLVVNKPVGIPCIPTKRYPNHTFSNYLLGYYKEKGIAATVHLVNRLDKDTSGLVVVAKTGYDHSLLSSNIKQVERVYHCVVEGNLEGSGTIIAPIAKSDTDTTRVIHPDGKYACTHYRVLRSGENSIVECVLETGRTHQIRVHMAHIGHPLVGDTMYGSNNQTTYQLESISVRFIHPRTNQTIFIKKQKMVHE